MSHCFLVVPPDAEDEHCEEFCGKLRVANLLTWQVALCCCLLRLNSSPAMHGARILSRSPGED